MTNLDGLYSSYLAGQVEFDALVSACRAHALGQLHGVTAQQREDVAQTVVVRLLESMPTYQGRGAFSHWLNRLIMSVRFDAGRSGARQPEQYPADNDTEQPQQPEATASCELSPHAMPDAVSLPDSIAGVDRHMCQLILQGLTHAEVAARLQMSTAAVRQRFKRLVSRYSTS